MSLNDVRKENEKLRIDSAFFGKEALLLEKLVRNYPTGSVEIGRTASKFRKGIFDIKADSYTNVGVPFIRISNLRRGVIDDSGIAFISEEAHITESKTEVRRDDLVISKTAYPAASYVQLEKANVSQDIIAYSLTKEWKPLLKSGYLVAFLNSRVGLALMQRQFQGNVQLHLSLDDGRKVPIPLIGMALQEAIAASFLESFNLIEHSKVLLREAEQTLLEELGLADWTPPEPLTYQRRASDVFATGRIDAEHFQESYIDLAKRLQQYQHGYVRLGDICPNPINGVEIREYEESGVPYLRVGDLHNLTVKLDEVKLVSETAAAREIEKVRLWEGDVLVSRSGSLAVTGVVEREWMHSVISSHLIRVRIEDSTFDPYYVASYLAARPGKMLITQYSNGGVQPEINQPSLKSIIIPRLASEVQSTIRSQIELARSTRQRAHELLERAKRAVEIAIEDSEAAGLAYLNTEGD